MDSVLIIVDAGRGPRSYTFHANRAKSFQHQGIGNPPPNQTPHNYGYSRFKRKTFAAHQCS